MSVDIHTLSKVLPFLMVQNIDRTDCWLSTKSVDFSRLSLILSNKTVTKVLVTALLKYLCAITKSVIIIAVLLAANFFTTQL